MSIQAGQTILFNDIYSNKNRKWSLIGGTWSSSSWASGQTPFGSGNLWSKYSSGIPLLFVWYYKAGKYDTVRYYTSLGTWKGGLIDDGTANSLIVSITLPFTGRTSSKTDFITKWYSITGTSGAISALSSFVFSMSTSSGSYGTIGSFNTNEVLYPYRCYALTGDIIG